MRSRVPVCATLGDQNTGWISRIANHRSRASLHCSSWIAEDGMFVLLPCVAQRQRLSSGYGACQNKGTIVSLDHPKKSVRIYTGEWIHMGLVGCTNVGCSLELRPLFAPDPCMIRVGAVGSWEGERIEDIEISDQRWGVFVYIRLLSKIKRRALSLTAYSQSKRITGDWLIQSAKSSTDQQMIL